MNNNIEWVQYDPMNVNNYTSGTKSGPYRRAASTDQTFIDDHEQRSLLLIYTAVDLSANLAVHQR